MSVLQLVSYTDLIFCIATLYGNNFADKAILGSHVIMSYLLWVRTIPVSACVSQSAYWSRYACTMPKDFRRSLDDDVAFLNLWWDTKSTHLPGIFNNSRQTPHTHGDNVQKHHLVVLRFSGFLMSHNSETAGWKNFVPGSWYCRATQELQNGGWIMGIGPSEPKCPTFCARHFLWALATSMHKNVHCGGHERLRVIGLEWEESRRVALSSGLCLESWKWRMARYEKKR